MAKRSIFLVVETPPGSTQHVQLFDGKSSLLGDKVYLPKVFGEEIELARTAPNAITYVELEKLNDFVALRVFGDDVVLTDSGYHLPRSTSDNQYTLLLRDQDRFTSFAGRWGIEYDDQHGSLANSMRPPQLPQPAPAYHEEIATPEVPDNLSSNQDDRDTIPQKPTQGGACEIADIISQEVSSTSVVEADDRLVVFVSKLGAERRRESSAFASGSSAVQTGEYLGRSVESPTAEYEARTAATNSDDDDGSIGTSIFRYPIERATSDYDTEDGQSLLRAGYQHRQIVETVETLPLHSENPEIKHDQKNSPASVPPQPAVEKHSKSKKKTSKKRKVRTETTSAARQSKRQKQQSFAKNQSLEPETETEDVGNTIEAVAPTPTQDREPFAKRNSLPSDSPARNTRSHITPKPSQHPVSSTLSSTVGAYAEDNYAVFFATSSEIWKKQKTMDTFRSLGGTQVATVSEANVFCIGSLPLRKSVNFLLSIAHGCDVVLERWIIDSHRAGGLKALTKYLPMDLIREREWAFHLKDAVHRGKTGLGHLLAGFHVYFTSALDKELQVPGDFAGLVLKLGAIEVEHALPSKMPDGKMLILGVKDDPEGARVGRLGQKLYHRDLVAMGVLRGELELDSPKFLMDITIKDEDSGS